LRFNADAHDLPDQADDVAGIVFAVGVGFALHLILVDDPFERRNPRIIEAVFQRVPGVKKVVSGFSGGHVANPTYEQVCEKNTGHAEVAQVEFDPAVLKLDTLLDVFFVAHDPTTLNRQGADKGPQYRSVIFYANEEQKKAAEAAKVRAKKEWSDPIVTEIAPLKAFYAAEDYHQNYFNLNKNRNPYCSVVIAPKLHKLVEKGVIKE